MFGPRPIKLVFFAARSKLFFRQLETYDAFQSVRKLEVMFKGDLHIFNNSLVYTEYFKSCGANL